MNALRQLLWGITILGILFITSCASIKITKDLIFNQSISVIDDYTKTPKVTNTIIQGQEFKIAVTFAWETKGGAGPHKRTWKFYKDGKYFGNNETIVDMYKSPFTVEITCKSIDKDPGNYDYELYIDDILITTLRAKIVKVE